MIFDAAQIPFVLSGETTTTTLPLNRKRLPRKGQSYAIRSRKPAIHDEDGRIVKPTQIKTITRAIIRNIKKDPQQQTWIVTFELDPSAPPYLMHQQSERGYTTQRREALDKDADVIEPEILEDYARQNWQRHLARKAQEAQESQRSLTERLQALLDAQASGIDVSRQLASIRQRIAAAERALRRAA